MLSPTTTKKAHETYLQGLLTVLYTTCFIGCATLWLTVPFRVGSIIGFGNHSQQNNYTQTFLLTLV